MRLCEFIHKEIYNNTTQLTFIYAKSTIETLGQGVDFEYVSHFFQVFLLLTWNK